MVMLPNPPKFFWSSRRHVLWQIEQLDITLGVAGRMLKDAITTEQKAAARERVNALLDHRLDLMRQRDELAARKALP